MLYNSIPYTNIKTNKGQNFESFVRFHFDGIEPNDQKHDSKPFWVGCDIESQNASVKLVERCSLCTVDGTRITGNTLEEIAISYLNADMAKNYILGFDGITENVYETLTLNETEFHAFILKYGILDRESTKNARGREPRKTLRLSVRGNKKQRIAFLETLFTVHISDRMFIDMDGTIADFFKDADCLQKMVTEGYFQNLPKLPFADVINSIATFHKDIYILSACVDTPFCKAEKIEWIKANMPNLNIENIILCMVGENKAEVIEALTHKAVNQNDTLFDDYTKNLNEWEAKNGTAVKVLNGINNTTKTWKGMMVG